MGDGAIYQQPINKFLIILMINQQLFKPILQLIISELKMPEAETISIEELNLKPRDRYVRKKGIANVIRFSALKWYEVEGRFLTDNLIDVNAKRYLARSEIEAYKWAENDGLQEVRGIRLLQKK